MPRSFAMSVGALLLALTVLPLNVEADGAWLDGPVTDWNRPGMAIPRAPVVGPDINPGCPAGRPPESAREQAVVDAGWKLYGGQILGTPVEHMSGLAGYDGMCRPMQFQTFVFVDGKFAGTLSPVPMDSRSDGGLTGLDILNLATYTARYARYTPRDALCCPSAISTAIFEIDRSGSGPILSLRSLSTEATGAQPPATGPSPVPTVVPNPAPVQAPAQLPRRP